MFFLSVGKVIVENIGIQGLQDSAFDAVGRRYVIIVRGS